MFHESQKFTEVLTIQKFLKTKYKNIHHTLMHKTFFSFRNLSCKYSFINSHIYTSKNFITHWNQGPIWHCPHHASRSEHKDTLQCCSALPWQIPDYRTFLYVFTIFLLWKQLFITLSPALHAYPSCIKISVLTICLTVAMKFEIGNVLSTLSQFQKLYHVSYA